MWVAKYVLPALQQVLGLVLGLPVFGLIVNVSLSAVASCVRVFTGAVAAHNINMNSRPQKTLILYQYEACPYCRLVREALSVLALEVVVYPCPRLTLGRYGVSEGSRYRPEAIKLTGKCMFPTLVDPNFDPPLAIVESKDIITHIWKTYGAGASNPWNSTVAYKLKRLVLIPTLLRPMPYMGLIRTPSRDPPDQLLVLYSYESCPFSRLCRECLDSIEIPYRVVNVPPFNFSYGRLLLDREASTLRAEGLLPESIPALSVPVLVDRNTGTVKTDAMGIVTYLKCTYALGEAQANWSDYSTAGADDGHGVIPGFKQSRALNDTKKVL